MTETQTHTAEAGDVTTLREAAEALASEFSGLETVLAGMDADIPDREPLWVKAGNRRQEVGTYGHLRRLNAALAASPAPRAPAAVPAYGIIDPDYARVFTVARCIAWSEGYALLMHGSFTRDLDLLAVPWAEQATDAEHLVRRISVALDDLDLLVKDPKAPSQATEKPHGRLAWTFTFKTFGDPRFVDLSVIPRTLAAAPAAPPADGGTEGVEDDDPNEPIPGIDCSPYGMSPVLMNYRLRKEARGFTQDDRNEAADLIDRLVGEIEALSSRTPAGAAGDLLGYVTRQWAWSKETFGPALRTKGIVQHITKELREIEAKPHDLSEWVDVIILAMDGFWRHGGKPEDLLPAMQAKQDKNFARDWPDWRTMGEDQAIEHDRSGEATRPASPAPAEPDDEPGYVEDAPLTSTEAVAQWEAEQKAALAPAAQVNPGREEIAEIIQAHVLPVLSNVVGAYIDPASIQAAADAILDARPVAEGDAEILHGEMSFFTRCVKALLLHTNPHAVNEGHAQQWFAVSDAIRLRIEPLLSAYSVKGRL